MNEMKKNENKNEGIKKSQIPAARILDPEHKRQICILSNRVKSP